MIKDKEALQALPSTGFIRDYCRYAVRQNSAPVAYHVGCAYMAVANMIHPEFAIRIIDPQRPLHVPLWIKLVGSSGDYKSWSLEIFSSLIREVDAGLIGGTPGTSEGLFDAVKSQEQQCIVWSDMGDFYAKSDGGSGYAADLRDSLLKYFDCVPVTRRLSNGKDMEIRNPRLSLIGAVTPAHLEEHTNWKHWGGGFASRWITIHATSERFVPVSEPMPGLWRSLIEQLQDIRETPWGDCTGFTDEARELWDSVARTLYDRTRSVGDKVGAAYTRVGVTALRCGVLAAITLGHAKVEETWLLDVECFRLGLAMARMQRSSIEWALSSLCVTPYQRNRRALMEYIQGARAEENVRRGGATRLLPEIARHMKLPNRALGDLLAGLEQEGSINRILSPSATWFVAQDIEALKRREATMEPVMVVQGNLNDDDE